MLPVNEMDYANETVILLIQQCVIWWKINFRSSPFMILLLLVTNQSTYYRPTLFQEIVDAVHVKQQRRNARSTSNERRIFFFNFMEKFLWNRFRYSLQNWYWPQKSEFIVSQLLHEHEFHTTENFYYLSTGKEICLRQETSQVNKR